MAAYSLTQFVSVLLLYSIDSNLADIQFLYIDLFLITTFAFFFGLTEAYEGDLDPHPPMKSLISLTPITSLILQLAIIIGFQARMSNLSVKCKCVRRQGSCSNYYNLTQGVTSGFRL